MFDEEPRLAQAGPTIEVAPAWIAQQHPGLSRPGWAHCRCPASRHGGHRSYRLDCCGAEVVPGCRNAPVPPLCRDGTVDDVEGTVERS